MYNLKLKELREKIDFYDLQIFYLEIERIIVSQTSLLYKDKILDSNREEFIFNRFNDFSFKDVFNSIQKKIIELSKDLQTKKNVKIYIKDKKERLLFVLFFLQIACKISFLKEFTFIFTDIKDADIVFSKNKNEDFYNLKIELSCNTKTGEIFYPNFMKDFLDNKNARFYNNFLDLINEKNICLPSVFSAFIENFDKKTSLYFDNICLKAKTEAGRSLIFTLNKTCKF